MKAMCVPVWIVCKQIFIQVILHCLDLVVDIDFVHEDQMV